MKSIIEKIKAFSANLFGKKTKAQPKPAEILSGAALSHELNKQSNASPLSGAALTEQLNKVPVASVKKSTKKTSKKKA